MKKYSKILFSEVSKVNTGKTSVHKRRLPPVGFLLLCSFDLEKYYFILFDAESTGLIYNEGREFLPTEKNKIRRKCWGKS